jgi:magnesium transporter
MIVEVKTIQLYLSDLKELLENNEFVSARTCLREISPIDLADAWDHFTPDERRAIFRLSTRQKAIQLFEELDPPAQLELLSALQEHDAEKLLEELDPSETGRMLRGLPQNLVRQLTSIMKKGGFETVQPFLEFPPKTVGALMRSRYVTLDPKWHCKQALERVQLSTRLRRIEETYLDILIVTDPDGRLLGTVGLKSLVVAPRDMLVKELMDPSPVTLKPAQDQEDAVKLFSRYKLKAAPVVGDDRKVMGLVVYQDIFEIASEETEEDFAKMAGVGGQVGELGVLSQALARLPWLIITCFGGLMVSSVIKHFEATLAQIIALATFSPLIAGMGGNVGSQTATIVVRGLATGHIKKGKERETVVKEVLVGALMGLTYGIAVGSVAYFFYGARYGWKFSFVVGAAMLFSITVSSLMASLEPFILRHFGVDPATATGPLITTTTDLLSNLAYFGMATYLLLN